MSGSPDKLLRLARAAAADLLGLSSAEMRPRALKAAREGSYSASMFSDDELAERMVDEMLYGTISSDVLASNQALHLGVSVMRQPYVRIAMEACFLDDDGDHRTSVLTTALPISITDAAEWVQTGLEAAVKEIVEGGLNDGGGSAFRDDGHGGVDHLPLTNDEEPMHPSDDINTN